MSNFDFLRAAWPLIADAAIRAERNVIADPRASLFYARRTMELVVNWLYQVEGKLRPPYKNDLAAKLFEPSFRALVGQGIQKKMDLVRHKGNDAVHQDAAFAPADSLRIIHEVFQVAVWVATHYSPKPADRPVPGVRFDDTKVPTPQSSPASKTRAQLLKLEDDLKAKDAEISAAEARNVDLTAMIALLQEEVEKHKAANSAVPDTHDYREDETRDLFIDLLLDEAGWPLDEERDREFPVFGMPNNSAGGKGFVDYVLWGVDGLPLAVVEAKRTRKSAMAGQQQAKLYADRLEAQFGQRPVIFYTNGYDHWFWDDTSYAPRPVQGFYTREQLELIVQRRTTRSDLRTLPISSAIADRHYQQRAVRKVADAFEHGERRALLVMATGSGKTRTVIALSDLLIRGNWAKRILFLADRVALVNQAANAFKALLPDGTVVNLGVDEEADGRVYVSTYPRMMGLIDQVSGRGRRFGPGHFDLVIVDEAHRSVYQKYGAIFGYFDSLLVGLTATPKDEIDHNTYGLFNLEDGVPTDSYDLVDAIAEGYLVSPVGRSIATKFVRDGIKYSDLSESERELWDLLEWDDGLIPDAVDPSAMNQWLFNSDTVDKVLGVLMSEGRRVAGGDRIGKTIIFAKNQKHAEFIATRFDANYPEFKGELARVVTHSVSYAQNLIDMFSISESPPHIAISVDMLDTGIDVPDVINLVFFKPVHSRTKYWQMVGRGTRLRPDLYGPGDDKIDFVIFDVCQNIEYFNQDLPTSSTSQPASLRKRLFTERLALIAAIDAAGAQADLAALREGLAAGLHERVAGMTLDNFLVRRHRREVERFADPRRWLDLSGDDLTSAATLGDLPSVVDADDTDEQAKRFDMLALRAQIGLLSGMDYSSARSRIQGIANVLAEQKSIPDVARNLELLAQVADDDWWIGVTAPHLEMMRIRMRSLVRLIDTSERSIVYTNFEDSPSDAGVVILKHVAVGVDRARFREKALAFLQGRENDIVLAKVRTGKQLTSSDLDELERILIEAAGLPESEVALAATTSAGLGLFVRSLLGLDRAAATDALSEFTAGSTFSGNQLTFFNLLVEQLTERGAVEPELLFRAPFTDIAPTGPTGLFTVAQVSSLVDALRRVRATAQVLPSESA